MSIINFLKNKKGFIFKALIVVLLFAAASIFSYHLGYYSGEKNILQTSPSQIINQDLNKPEKVNFSIFWEAWWNLEKNYLRQEDLDYQEMVYGAISGMVQSLGDPYTNFFTPQEAEDFQEQLSGEYQGVGMIVGVKEEELIVVSPFKDSPAEKAGLKTGDKIIEINGVYTRELSIDEAVSLIKGEEGTTVNLLIQREGWSQARIIEVARETIEIPTLEWEIKDEKIAVIKIYHFNDILNREFKEAAFEILKSEADSIVLDLRNNPGGYLEVAQDIAGWFLEKGDVVVWEDEGTDGEKKAYKADGPASFRSFPIVVLINGGTASGAEILAGALRDQRDIQLIGETSFGKGTVQKPVLISDNSYLKITVARWLTPDGTSLSEKGLEPDIVVENELEDSSEIMKDHQMDKAIEIIKTLR
jgi:carboxyl-terminal processing protease